jgi:hypothetical protein
MYVSPLLSEVWPVARVATVTAQQHAALATQESQQSLPDDHVAYHKLVMGGVQFSFHPCMLAWTQLQALQESCRHSRCGRFTAYA